MKARPLSTMPQVQQLADAMQMLVTGHPMSSHPNYWNIGINPVLYRDGRDRIGYHADDDQGEELVLTALVNSPKDVTRRISIRTRKKSKSDAGNADGDEQFELFLDAGDAYSMDGEMQKYYEHGVPCDKQCESSSSSSSNEREQKRIALVFRMGKEVMQATDSGKPCANLQPRVPVPYKFGRIEGCVEANTYSRHELNTILFAHRSQQKGVSGNRDDGCDAIIVSGLRSDGLGVDNLFTLTYAANTREGALAIMKSAVKDSCIRVFRSSVLKSPFRCVGALVKQKPAHYRYDGLYKVDSIDFKDGDGIVSNIDIAVEHSSSPTGVYLFHLSRIDGKHGDFENMISNNNYLEHAIGNGTMPQEASESVRQNNCASSNEEHARCCISEQERTLESDVGDASRILSPKRSGNIRLFPQKRRHIRWLDCPRCDQSIPDYEFHKEQMCRPEGQNVCRDCLGAAASINI